MASVILASFLSFKFHLLLLISMYVCLAQHVCFGSHRTTLWNGFSLAIKLKSSGLCSRYPPPLTHLTGT